MDYQETLHWLYEQLPMYQREGMAAYKANLDNTFALDRHFGSPHLHFKTIHVGGTNGKGSVSHMLASVLQEAGYKTGLYTSPHLKDFRERVKINGEMIPEQYVTDFVSGHHAFFTRLKPSFFEMTVAMAFQYFADQQVEIAIIEVGLGGRLDSTNIITPLLSVITNISYDHVALLGDTLEKIAAEKAGIIKPGVPVVIGTRDSETDHVFEARARECHSEIRFASDNWEVARDSAGLYDIYNQKGEEYHALHPDLKGLYQRHNLPTLLESLAVLLERGIEIPRAAICHGISRTVRNTGLLGRWQELNHRPYTVADTGHNIAGLTEVVAQLRTIHHDRLHVVFGMVNDKDIDHVLAILPKEAIYYFTKASIPRAFDEKTLAEKASAYGLTGSTHPTVHEAYQAAKKGAKESDMIYIGGSTFVVAEVV